MKSNIEGLNLPNALLYYSFASIPFFISIYIIIPLFVSENGNNFIPFSTGILLPLFLLLIYVIIIGKFEQSESGWKGLINRWNLKKMEKSDWLWTVFLITVILLGYFSLAETSDWIIERFPFLTPPKEFDLIITENSFFGLPLKGNWWVLVLHIAVLILNIFGEELFFRGILFPKQKIIHKKHTWIVHGLCYHLFHMFYPWNFLRILPESLAYDFVVQKTNNTWPGIIAHFTFNSLALIGTIYGDHRIKTPYNTVYKKQT
jgi:membrane protease YdiL (CAAX protease family)